MSVYVAGCVIPDSSAKYWDEMKSSKLWGETDAEILEYLIMAEIRRAVGKGLIERLPPDELIVEEAPSAEVDCQHCKNGTDVPADIGRETYCPHCRRDLIDIVIPF